MDSRSQLGMAVLNPAALSQTLRTLCCDDSQWVYAVFWRILPRNYPPPQWDTESGFMDRSKGNKRNWILQWEDGFCNFAACAAARNARSLSAPASFLSVGRHNSCIDLVKPEAMNPELFFKMSHEVYNYGEGLMGKVAADSSHKWVYQEPLEHEIGFFSSPWHGSTDSHPRTWEGQFKSGIQTIAVVSVQEGVLQLGSTNKIMEDLNFVLYMQRRFNFLHTIPVSHPASSSGGASKRGIEAMSPDTASTMANNQLIAPRPRDHFLVPGVSPEPRSPIFAPIAPAKKRGRVSASSEPVIVSNRYVAQVIGGSGVNKCTQEGNPSPRALNTDIPPFTCALSAMSSLQNLLSKLPSVTGPMDDNNGHCSYPINGGFEVINCGGFADFNGDHLPTLSSDSSHGLHRMMDPDCVEVSPADYSNEPVNLVLEGIEIPPLNYTNGENYHELEVADQVQPRYYRNGGDYHALEAADQVQAPNYRNGADYLELDAADEVQPQISYKNGANHVLAEVQPQHQRNMVAQENHTRHNSMFESFENIAEFDALESGEYSYTSFLNEMCS